MNKPDVAIILVNYQGALLTQECLKSLSRLDYKTWQVFVVDNASPGGDFESIQKWCTANAEKFVFPPVVIASDRNGGFAAGNNVALRRTLPKSDFKYFWLLNNDTLVEPDSLSHLVAGADARNLGVAGSRLLYYPSGIIQALGASVDIFTGTTHWVSKKEDLHRVNYIPGASMLISRNCLESCGFLPEEYFLYFEETDFCFTARAHGFQLGVIEASTVHHRGGATRNNVMEEKQRSAFFDCLILCNRIKFARKHLKHPFLIWAGLTASLVRRILQFQPRRAWIVVRLLSSRSYFERFCGLDKSPCRTGG
jgi:GT2 family glycosyltransferase